MSLREDVIKFMGANPYPWKADLIRFAELLDKQLTVPQIAIKLLKHEAKAPKFASAGAACADIATVAAVEIAPGSVAQVPTGLSFEIPVGYEIQVRPRSGLALNKGLTILNTPGTIDSDYRGEVFVLLYNTSSKSVKINAGDRIAQIAVSKTTTPSFVIETDSLSATERGEGGFGSTGE